MIVHLFNGRQLKTQQNKLFSLVYNASGNELLTKYICRTTGKKSLLLTWVSKNNNTCLNNA